MPSFYLALELPADEASLVADVMSKLGDRSPLPHITVIPPQSLGPDLAWLHVVRDTVAHCQKVTVTFGQPRTFHDRVLYLAVEATNLAPLHTRLSDALRASAAGGEDSSEERNFVPHLTLAVARRGRALPPYHNLVAVLHDLPPFEATSVAVFRRDNAREPYRAWQHLALAVE